MITSASLRFVTLLALAVTSSAAAQPDPYTVEQLAPGVFGVIRRVPTTGASDANVMFIVNDADVVVVDANIFPSSTREVIREIRARTDKPVRYVINTHWHSDHHYGNAEYRKAWPAAEFIQHAATRDLILTQDVPALARNLATTYPETITRLKAQLATGKRADGTMLTDAERARAERSLRLYTFFSDDVRGMEQVPASITVADSLVLHRGERTIVVKWLGKGNTPGDLVVHLPRERIVATGDLVVSPMPFGFGSFVGEWPSTLRRLKALDPVTVMPGHGFIMKDWSYVDRLIPMFESIHEQVRRAVAAGADLAATRKAVDFAAWRADFAGDDEGLQRGFTNNFATPIIEAAFNEVKGDTLARRP